MDFCQLKKLLGLTKTLNKNHAPKNLINEEVKFKKGTFIISETNEKGLITYANDIFIEMSGYSKKELLCANHNLIRHPDMPRITFKLLWNTIKENKVFEGFVKNLRKDGRYYLVYAKVNRKNKKYYISVREPVNKYGWLEISKIYKILLEEEKKGGMEASYKKLLSLLNTDEENLYNDYMKFVKELQYM